MVLARYLNPEESQWRRVNTPFPFLLEKMQKYTAKITKSHAKSYTSFLWQMPEIRERDPGPVGCQGRLQEAGAGGGSLGLARDLFG